MFWRLFWFKNPTPLVQKPAILREGGGGLDKNGTSPVEFLSWVKNWDRVQSTELWNNLVNTCLDYWK